MTAKQQTKTARIKNLKNRNHQLYEIGLNDQSICLTIQLSSNKKAMFKKNQEK